MFDDGDLYEWDCVHGYFLGEGCPDCDVPSHLPAVLANEESVGHVKCPSCGDVVSRVVSDVDGSAEYVCSAHGSVVLRERTFAAGIWSPVSGRVFTVRLTSDLGIEGAWAKARRLLKADESIEYVCETEERS